MKTALSKVIFLFLFSSTNAYACKCAVPSAEIWGQAKAVFVGKVISEEDLADDSAHNSKLFKVAVLDSLKDPMPKVVLISTPISSAMCGVKFEESKVYTFFSGTKSAPYSVNHCGGTHEGDPSKEELRAMKRPR